MKFEPFSFLLGLLYIIICLNVTPVFMGVATRLLNLPVDRGLFGLGTIGFNLCDKLIIWLKKRKLK